MKPSVYFKKAIVQLFQHYMNNVKIIILYVVFIA